MWKSISLPPGISFALPVPIISPQRGPKIKILLIVKIPAVKILSMFIIKHVNHSINQLVDDISKLWTVENTVAHMT